MKYAELDNKTLKDLYQVVYDLKKDLLSIRFQRSAMQDVKTHEIRAKRKDIARVMTRIGQLKLSAKKG